MAVVTTNPDATRASLEEDAVLAPGRPITETPRASLALAHLGSIAVVLAVGTGLAALGGLAPWLAGRAPWGTELQQRAWSAHGVVMLYLGLLAGAPGLFGYALTSRGGGASLLQRELAQASLGLYWISALLILVALALGGVQSGYDLSLSYGTEHGRGFLWLALGVLFSALSASLSGAQWIVHLGQESETPSVALPTLTLAWMLAIAGVAQILAAGVLAVIVVLMAAEEFWRIGMFLAELGGDPRLLRHLFWFYLHPCLVVCLLPAFGVMEMLLGRAGDPEGEGIARVGAAHLGLAVALFGALSWGRYLFADGLSFPAETAFAFTGLLLTLALLALVARMLRPRPPGMRLRRYRAVAALGVGIPLVLTLFSTAVLTLPRAGELLLATGFVRGHLHAVAFSSVLAIIPTLLVLVSPDTVLLDGGGRWVSRVALWLVAGECCLLAGELCDVLPGLRLLVGPRSGAAVTAPEVTGAVRDVGLWMLVVGGLCMAGLACKARRSTARTEDVASAG